MPQTTRRSRGYPVAMPPLLLLLAPHLALAADRCPLMRLSPPGTAISVQTAAGELSRSSLLRPILDLPCEDGVSVRIVAVQPWYRTGAGPLPQAGQALCLSAALLAPVADAPLMVWAPPPGAPRPALPEGTVLAGYQDPADCGDPALLLADGRRLPDRLLLGSAPTTAAALDQATALAARISTRLAPLSAAQVRVNDWGRVALPMAEELDAAGIADEVARESLLSPAQQERATVAWGPDRAWSHFPGSDAPLSDLWGEPGFTSALVDLLIDWRTHCRALPGMDPARCLVQVGDLAWHNDQKPDPLGHKDHFEGSCVDLRLFRSDGSRYEAWWNRPDDRPGRPAGYDPLLTGAFVAFARARPDTSRLIFNDPAIPAERARGHDDHLHLCLDPG